MIEAIALVGVVIFGVVFLLAFCGGVRGDAIDRLPPIERRWWR